MWCSIATRERMKFICIFFLNYYKEIPVGFVVVLLFHLFPSCTFQIFHFKKSRRPYLLGNYKKTLVYPFLCFRNLEKYVAIIIKRWDIKMHQEAVSAFLLSSCHKFEAANPFLPKEVLVEITGLNIWLWSWWEASGMPAQVSVIVSGASQAAWVTCRDRTWLINFQINFQKESSLCALPWSCVVWIKAW